MNIYNRDSERIDDPPQQGVDYLVEQVKKYLQQEDAYAAVYEQSIHNIRPKKRSLPPSGYNTPITATAPPPYRPPLAAQTTHLSDSPPPVVGAGQYSGVATSPPPIASAGINSRPPLAAQNTHLSYSPPPVVGAGQSIATSPPPIASAGIISRPSFAVDVVVGFRELSVDLAKCVRDVVYQNYYVVTKLMHLLLLLMFLALAALCVNLNRESDSTSPLITKPFLHPPNGTHILLPDGRHLAYHEQGVPAKKARFTIIAPPPLLSSRLAGIPGLKISLMQEFGVRLITYDIPGFGMSDPHPNRNLKTSAADMLQLSYSMGVTDKFWVVGYSSGSLHAWAALKYIPDRLAGAFMVSPMINPYEPGMSKEERHRTWSKWSHKRRFMYFLARRYPRFLAYFYRKSFMSSNVGQRNHCLLSSLGKRDRTFIEGEMIQEFWHRDVEESLRQENAKPLMEEVVLQVSSWGFSLDDLNVKKKDKSTGIFQRLKSMYSADGEEPTGLLGAIHIWQGMDDKVVPPSMVEYVERVLPGAMVHKLFYHGHLTYFYFCHECHREMFGAIFGDPKGPLTAEVDCTTTFDDTNVIEEVK